MIFIKTKAFYLIGILLFVFLSIYCVTLKKENNQYNNYVNETLNTELKTLTNDIEQTQKLLSQIINKKEVTALQLESMNNLYSDMIDHIQELYSIRQYLKGDPSKQEETKELLFTIKNYLRTFDGNKELTKENIDSFRKMQDINVTMQKVLPKKKTMNTRYDVKGDQWSILLNNLDEKLVKNDLIHSF